MPLTLIGTSATAGERVKTRGKYKLVGDQRGVQLRNENTWMRWSLHGLGPATLDRTGNISLPLVCKLLDSVLASALCHPSYITNRLVDPPIYAIIVVNYHMERALYKRICQGGMNISLDLTNQLAGFGKISVDYASTVEDPMDKEVLARMSIKCASFDLQTRKVAPIPDPIKERYAKYCDRELMTAPFRTQQKPENTPSMSYFVRSSDIDVNLHIKHTEYFRLFTDAADEAVQRGLFKQFKEDILLYHAKTMQALYVKECKRGETLEVYTWEDVDISFKLHCVVEKAGEAVFRGNIEFYPLELSKL